MVYKKDNYRFRPVTSEDLILLSEHRNDPDTYMNLTSSLPVWPHYQDYWLDKVDNNNMYFIGQSIAGNELAWSEWHDVAIIRLTDFDWVSRNVCVGLDVFKEHRGHGHASKLFSMLVEYCFVVLNMNRLWLLVSEKNSRAIKIYKNANFIEEGQMRKHLFKNNEYINYILMGLLRDEWKRVS